MARCDDETRSAQIRIACAKIVISLPCSRRTFERKFRESTGLSPVQACVRFRLEEARRLLVKTELAVEEVAERSGFGDILQLQVASRNVLRQTAGAVAQLRGAGVSSATLR